MKGKKNMWMMVIIGIFCILLNGGSVEASGGEFEYEDGILPRYVSIEGSSCKMSINKGIATCIGRVTVKENKSCTVKITLQKKSGGSWIDVVSWNGSGITSCTVNKTRSVSKGVSYRVKNYFTCGSESGTVYSSVCSY